jgi:hypothetical protein
VGGQVEIDNIDLSINIPSIVIAYKKVGHEISYYYNGVHRITNTAPAGNEAEVISWANSDNLYVNRFFKYTPWADAHYHRIAVFDKILTPHEIVNIYNVSQPGYTPPPPPTPPTPPIPPTLHWDFTTLYDNNQAAEFTNPFNIQIVDEKAVIDRTGPNYYLKSHIPI